jgi:alpha-D-xyloside xylohydrolase
VYLPDGSDWYDFWTGDRFSGGQTIAAEVDLSAIPLYVRAGSIVPMTQPQQYVDEQPNAPVELHVFPGQDGAFQLYEDGGDGYDYEQGAFATIDIRWHDAVRRLIIGARQGDYPGVQQQREFIVISGTECKPVTYSGQQVEVDLTP